MTIYTLTLYIAIAAVVMCLLTGLSGVKVRNWAITFFQYFTGSLFVFSGAVKAVDPLGTAYKMEQYFAEFETTFAGTWFSFIAPLFPKLSAVSSTFSVVMIVFEIVLGIMLIIGAYRKMSAWAFFLLVLFFAFLTGFTYLTGYVPEKTNFFQFAKWGPYVETNMKVTDCGCFGDFLKLKPGVSFMKDVVLMAPALLFLWRHRDMHQLFQPNTRLVVTALSIVGLTYYSLSNYVWDLPDIDFRPFKIGVNIAEQKDKEAEAENAVEIVAYKLTNKKSGESVEIPYAEFLQKIQQYPTEEWEYEQIKSEPAIPRSKISDFEVSDVAGNDVTEDILRDSNYSFMVIAYKLYGTETPATKTVVDTTFAIDTIRNADTVYLQKRITGTQNKEVAYTQYQWDEDYLAKWKKAVAPVMDAAQKESLKAYAITAYTDETRINDFKTAAGLSHPVYMADDILLKTIIRSNPGVVLLKNGKVVMNWHYKQLPDYAAIKAEHMK